AKLFGARVIATTSDPAKAERLRALGADAVINYRETPQWHQAVLEATDGRGVDHVVEVGGAGTLEQSLKAVTIEGRVSLVGWLTRKDAPTINMAAISATVVRMHRIAVGSRAQFRAMNRAIGLHHLTPVIDRVFPLSDAVAAFRYYEAGKYFGKIVISQG